MASSDVPVPTLLQEVEESMGNLNVSEKPEKEHFHWSVTTTSSSLSNTNNNDLGSGGAHNFDQRAPMVEFKHKNLDRTIKIHQCGANSSKFVGNTSSVIWPVATHFGRWLADEYSNDQNDGIGSEISVCELGAGTGLAGIVAALLPAFSKVLLTDQSIDLCEENIDMNYGKESNKIFSQKLVWGDETDIQNAIQHNEGKRFDILIASDVICHQERFVMEKLVESFDKLLVRKEEDTEGKGMILLAYEYRDDWFTTADFDDICKSFGFDINARSLEDDDDESDYMLYVIKRK